MGKGYAEGPAAEEAERRRDELTAKAPGGARPVSRLAIYGATADDPTKHFLGWMGEIDPDALFADGAAWGITVSPRPVAPRSGRRLV